MASAKDVADWMLKEFERHGQLWQEEAAYEIERRFGEEFVYINENGNTAIDRKVLNEFRKLTADTAVWERGDLMWRRREPWDTPGRRQAE